MAKRPPRLTKAERSTLHDVLKANGLGPCNHPDCNPREPSCGSNYVHLRALSAVEAAFRIGRGERAVEVES